jgi:hypothetical protein
VNIRSLTRGDGLVIGSAALLLIASFLPFYSVPTGYSGDSLADAHVTHSSQNLWHSATFPILPSVTLAAIIAAAALLFARSGQLAGRQVLGLNLEQWAVALSLFVGWTAVWATLFNNQDGVDKKVGAWLTLIFGIVIAVSAALSGHLPALKAPLAGAPRPQQPQPYGVGGPQPYGVTPQQAGYGYPGGAQSVDPAYGGAPAPQPPYGGGPAAAGPHAAQPTAAAPAPSADFTAFWFAVPVPRPLFAEDGSGGQIAELAPGTWYLAVDQRGQAIIAQTQDGRRGVLQDSSGIQRG